jgi:alkanesulfonate monooxygenase SsuD/methylene tetrahydromethanopterin reductase-like flavin-dependent oxidoreductase (luciferase family)
VGHLAHLAEWCWAVFAAARISRCQPPLVHAPVGSSRGLFHSDSELTSSNAQLPLQGIQRRACEPSFQDCHSFVLFEADAVDGWVRSPYPHSDATFIIYYAHLRRNQFRLKPSGARLDAEVGPGSPYLFHRWRAGATAMKLMWFHLMPYTELPEDFREKHPSVWVDIHSSLFDPQRAHHMYNDFMDELEFAAECGFDAVCVNEHHSNGYGLMPSPNLIASALARRTSDTALCVMGNSLALYNPPTRVAEEFAMIDCISGGRLIAGFPVGTPMDTCFAYGQNPSMLRDRYHEAHDLVMRAWTEQDTFAFNGRFNQQRYVNIWPRPVQKPHPPIWIPGGGSVETWQWCAAMDYVYAYLSYFGYKDGRATMQGFWDEMARLGKDRNPYRAGFLQFVGVAESRDEAMRLYREPAEYFYGRCLRVDPRWAMPPGYITEATQRAGVVGQIGRAASLQARQQARATTQMEDIVERGYVIIGSPDEVVEQLTEVATDLNVGHLMLLLQFGSMGKELAARNTKLFADRVLPELRGLFSEWEDRWWPQPMPGAERAEVPAVLAAE